MGFFWTLDPVSKCLPRPNCSNFMTHNQDLVEARAEDIFEDWSKKFFIDLTPLDESTLYDLALDTAMAEAN